MATRPTQRWRAEVLKQTAEIAAGTLDPAAPEAFATRLWPLPMVDDVDVVFDGFEEELRRLAEPPDIGEALVLLRTVIGGLNCVHDDYNVWETSEREDLCAYVFAALEEQGAGRAALAERHGCDPFDLTADWREW